MTQEKILTFKGTEKQISEVLQPLSLLSSIEHSDFFKKALRSNLNNLQVDENIYLNRLKEQYISFCKVKKVTEINEIDIKVYQTAKTYYDAMRLFCLDTQLISFNDIEMLEFEVNSSF